MRMPIRKMRPPAQIENNANRMTPTNPAHGCQEGIPVGELILRSISIGVKGGNKDSAVANLLVGSCSTGIIKNMGINIGIIAGNVRF